MSERFQPPQKRSKMFDKEKFCSIKIRTASLALNKDSFLLCRPFAGSYMIENTKKHTATQSQPNSGETVACSWMERL